MKHAQFQIFTSYEDALEELASLGIEHPYSIEEEDQVIIGGFFEQIPVQDLQTCVLVSLQDEIDWEEQLTFSPYYKEGLVEIDLGDFTDTASGNFLRLKAGPGFGDLSHPTTQLMLESLPQCVKGKNVVDIGCGNGILTLASLLLGAKTAYGIDIDETALSHAEENAALNQLGKNLFRKTLNLSELDDAIFLINMTLSEQKEVYKILSTLNIKGLYLISGVLEEQKSDFLEAFPFEDFSLLCESSKSGWSSFSDSPRLTPLNKT